MIVWQRPNLLILDEPTNHLDLATREALAIALNQFDGSVMLVSHDRALLRSVCDEFWLVGRGEVVPFDGDLEDYQRFLLEESKRLSVEARREQANIALRAESKRKAASQKQIQSEKRLKVIGRELQSNEQAHIAKKGGEK